MIDQKKDPEDAACFVCCNQAGYDRVAPKYYKAHHKFLDQQAIVQFTRRIGNQGMVLDAGCGTGNYTEALLNNNLNVVGADISASMLAFACQHVDPERLLQMDVLNPCFKERSFDAIWMKAAMVHISPRMAPVLLGRLRSLLKPGGIFYVSVRYGRGTELRQDGRIFFYYEDVVMRQLFRNSSFAVLEAWTGQVDRGIGDVKAVKYFLDYITTPVNDVC